MRSGLSSRRVIHWAQIAGLVAFLAWMLLDVRGFSALLRAAVGGDKPVLYPTVALPQLMGQQLFLAFTASGIAIAVGLGLGLAALSGVGRPFRDLIVNAGGLAQTIPTVAVLALAIPLTGYGPKPVIIALALYGVLPVVLNVIAGIESVSPDAVDAAEGMGMTPTQRMATVRLPLAFPVILAGVKNMVVINVSAATVGAIAAAGGLGQPIISGFQTYNPAFIIEGALPAAALALLVDRVLQPPRWAEAT